MSRNMRVSLYLLVFLNLCVPNAVPADPPLNETLELHQALALAYEQSPRMTYARQAVTQAEGDWITARTWRSPELEAEIGGLKDGEGNADEITFSQPFDPPGVRSLNARMSRNAVDIEKASVKAVWAEVYAEVRDVYAQLILNKEELRLKRDNLESMRRFFSDVQMRYQGGQAFKHQLQRAKIELLKAESEYLKTETELDVHKAKLNILLGRPRTIPFETTDSLKEESLMLTLDELIDMAESKRPDIQIEKRRLDSAKKNVVREQLSRLPAYSLGFRVVDGADEEDYAAVIALELPLWNLNRGEVKKARAERVAQDVRLQAVQNEAGFEVYAAYQEAQLSRKQLELFKESLIEANEMFRLAGLHYGEGQIGFLDYLDQLSAVTDSRLQYHEALYQLNRSMSALEKAVYSSLREEAFLQ